MANVFKEEDDETDQSEEIPSENNLNCQFQYQFCYLKKN